MNLSLLEVSASASAPVSGSDKGLLAMMTAGQPGQSKAQPAFAEILQAQQAKAAASDPASTAQAATPSQLSIPVSKTLQPVAPAASLLPPKQGTDKTLAKDVAASEASSAGVNDAAAPSLPVEVTNDQPISTPVKDSEKPMAAAALPVPEAEDANDLQSATHADPDQKFHPSDDAAALPQASTPPVAPSKTAKTAADSDDRTSKRSERKHADDSSTETTTTAAVATQATAVAVAPTAAEASQVAQAAGSQPLPPTPVKDDTAPKESATSVQANAARKPVATSHARASKPGSDAATPLPKAAEDQPAKPSTHSVPASGVNVSTANTKENASTADNATSSDGESPVTFAMSHAVAVASNANERTPATISTPVSHQTQGFDMQAQQAAGGASSPTYTSDHSGAEPHLLAQSSNVLEVGVSTQSHGWLRVRTELAADGTVSATVKTNSPGAQTSLNEHTAGIEHFLRNEQVRLDSLTVHAMPSTDSLGTGTQGSNAGANSSGQNSLDGQRDDSQRQQNQGANQQRSTLQQGNVADDSEARSDTPQLFRSTTLPAMNWKGISILA